MKIGLKEKIIELKSLGYSYKEIVSEIGCSKSTVSYHVGNGQKEKALLRRKKHDKDNIIKKKIYRFCSARKKTQPLYRIKKTVKQILFTKIRNFGDSQIMFKPQELLDKIGDNPKCYLTGRSIDLSDPKSYHLDHIIPKSRGGDNTIDNCGLACKLANLSKSQMTYEEYVELCREVILNHDNK
jgi:CRISPR/Cas system Type II protein with McrA/HNH and RuvC-like nuclease domain